jgi:transcriptional repressor NrdR
MKCPFCGQDNDRVIDSRAAEGGELTRRRRECIACSRRFTTVERVEMALPAVIKSDGRRETFNRDKILRGLRIACAKRPIGMEDLDRIANAVEQSAASAGQPEIESRALGAMVMRQLRALDDIAYIRFASVYRRFEDVDSLLAEAEGIRTSARPLAHPDEQPDLPL